MRVVFLAVNDWANVGWSYMQALKKVGVDTQGFKTNSHTFKYPNELEIITQSKLQNIQKTLNSADIVQIIHTSLVKMNLNLKKNFVIHHGGSAYRQSPEKINAFWNKIVKATIIETADLLHLGAKNEYYIPAPVDTDKLYPKSYYDGKRSLRIAHYPSSVGKKGTSVIKNILNSLKKDFNFDILISEKLVSWQDHIKRISDCDIYIDQFVPLLGGKRCGEYGVSGREAAALGKILVSTHLGVADYNKIFGDTKVFVSNTPRQIANNIKWLLGQSSKDIRRIQEETRNWIVTKHSYKHTGERLKSVYENILTNKVI